MKDGRADANGVLPSHEIVNDLQHWPIKGGCMVQPKDVALDPASKRNFCCET